MRKSDGFSRRKPPVTRAALPNLLPKGTLCEVVTWPENEGNMETLPFPGIVSPVQNDSLNICSTRSTVGLLLLSIALNLSFTGRSHVRWFALYQCRARKGWLMTLTLTDGMNARRVLNVTELVKMAAHTVVPAFETFSSIFKKLDQKSTKKKNYLCLFSVQFFYRWDPLCFSTRGSYSTGFREVVLQVFSLRSSGFRIKIPHVCQKWKRLSLPISTSRLTGRYT